MRAVRRRAGSDCANGCPKNVLQSGTAGAKEFRGPVDEGGDADRDGPHRLPYIPCP